MRYLKSGEIHLWHQRVYYLRTKAEHEFLSSFFPCSLLYLSLYFFLISFFLTLSHFLFISFSSSFFLFLFFFSHSLYLFLSIPFFFFSVLLACKEHAKLTFLVSGKSDPWAQVVSPEHCQVWSQFPGPNVGASPVIIPISAYGAAPGTNYDPDLFSFFFI